MAGSFYTGITRDDAGGLRYLYSPANVNIENPGPAGSVSSYVTNTDPSQVQLLYTSNLTLFAEAALTNNDAALAVLYPNILYGADRGQHLHQCSDPSSQRLFHELPLGLLRRSRHLVTTTNWVETVQTWYRHNFANLSLVRFTSAGWTATPIADIWGLTQPSFAALQTVNVTDGLAFAPFGVGTFVTNTSTKLFLTNTIAGEFFFCRRTLARCRF